MPTLAPGCHFVPRWRMMMLPARTRSPPNFFTPRRFDSESRPLREEPPAFLCAMVLLLCVHLNASFPVMNAWRSLNDGTVRFRLLRCGFFLGGGLLSCLLGRLGAFNKDFRYADGRQLLTMTALTARILAATLLERDDLRSAALLDNFNGNRSAFNDRQADLDVCAFANGENVAQLYDFASFASDLLDLQYIVRGNAVLLATGFDDCEHL